MKSRFLAAIYVLAVAVGITRAEVTRFQNGVAPTGEYAGCVDTRISIYNDAEARAGRSEGKV